MKRILTLAGSLLALAAAAQQRLVPAHPLAAATTGILTRQAEAAAPAAKTTAGRQRLIAVSKSNINGTDSTVYLWKNNTRFPAHNPKNRLSYIEGYDPFVDNSEVDSFNSRYQYIPCDSSVLYRAGGILSRKGYRYTLAGKPLRVTGYDAAGAGATLTQLAYDAAGNNRMCTYNDLQLQKTLALQLSGFDATNRLVADTVVSYSTGDTFWYSRRYDATGRLADIRTHATTYDSARTSFRYNAAGLVDLVTNEMYTQGSGWKASLLDSFIYSGSNPAYTARYLTVNLPNAQGWQVVQREQNTLNAAGNWTERLLQYRDLAAQAWINDQRDQIDYNAAGNYQTLRQSVANAGVFPTTPSQTYRFYYQTVDPAAVAGYEAPAAAFSVVPNPATGAFGIHRAGSGTATYTLIDATGRVAAQGSLAGNNETVRAEGLPRGLYLLTVRTGTAAPQTARVVLQ